MGHRGSLRVYLGAAPGVGKTYSMLGEGHRRADRGTDVVVAFVEPHGRRHTEEMLGSLEVVPRRSSSHPGAPSGEMDVAAVLARKPQVALVDDLAHTNAPGSENGKRWEDVEDLLAAGVDVLTTVDVGQLESVKDVVEKITGVPQRDTVPDAVVRGADQVELQDMTAEALRRRLAHGNIYAPEEVDAALASYFRAGSLNALRELALLWTADRVDDALKRDRARHDITATWEARERVVVALTGGPEGETLIRRAARIAARASGTDLLAVHVIRSDRPAGANQEALSRQRLLVESLGGSYHQVLGDGVPEALLSFARGQNATQLVLGDSRRRGLPALLSFGTARTTVRGSGDIDVHIVTHPQSGRGIALPRGRTRSRGSRRLLGYAVGLLLPALLAVLLVPLRGQLNLVSDVLLFLLVTAAVSLVGGLLPALICAVASSALLNYYFTPPLHTLSIKDTNNVLALLVFVVVASLVSSLVDRAARRSREAARAAAESRTLASLAGSVLAGEDALGEMLERVRETFGLTSVTLLERVTGSGDAGDAADTWVVRTDAGAPYRTRQDADVDVSAGPDLTLVLRGRVLEAGDQRLLGAFAAQVAVVVDRIRLSAAADAAGVLAEGNKMRTALLAAVGHDLRTPLAAAKAAVSSLVSPDPRLDPDDRHELVVTADESLDKLASLIDDLLDMSRLQAGAMSVDCQSFTVDEVLVRCLDDLGPDGGRVRVDPVDRLAPAMGDPALLERVLVNLLANALRYSAPETPPRVTCSRLGDHLQIRVVDRGPGIPVAARDRVFLPFQRLGDTDNSTGVGLGLALSRGLTEVMGGTLEPEETPGGGLTMVVSLPVGAEDGATAPGRRERQQAGP